MSIKLHQSAYEYAQKLIANRRCVLDQGDVWTDHKPARSAEKRFVEQYGLAAFGRWHLGEDDEQAEGSGRRYKFPYGDFRNVHRCALLRTETRARKYKYADIELAATHLRELLDALMDEKRSTEQGHASA
jgi:hypothetical protein